MSNVEGMVNVLHNSAWVIGPYLKVIVEYMKTLEKYPNPKAVNMTLQQVGIAGKPLGNVSI